MKFTCLQENLSKGLSIATKAIPTKSSLPILSNVLISAEDGQIKLAATNLETTIVTYVGASVEEEGSITVPAKLIKDFISNLSPSTIVANLKDDIMHLSSERTKSKFNGTNPMDYPNLPTFSKKLPHMELDPQVFGTAVANVAFAAATDQARPVFTGIFLNYDKGVLTIASSDGFRLSEKVLKVDSKLPAFSAIIPAKTLLEVARIFLTSEEPIKFALNAEDNLVLFEAEDTLVASQVLSGEYPNYKKIIPTENIITAEFLAVELLEAVKLTNVFAKEANSAIKMRFDPEGFIHVVSLVQETGEHESTMSAVIEGAGLEIAFNSRYLLDLLNNVKSEKILFLAKGSTSPCLFKPLEHEDFLHVIAPMQIQG